MLTACSGESATDPSAGQVCLSILGVALSPQDTTLNPGEHFRPTLRTSYCGELQDEVPGLRSNNTRVAAVEPVFGDVIARASGTAMIEITSKRFGKIGAITVSVR